MTVRDFALPDLPVVATLLTETVRRVNARDYLPEQVAAWAPDVPDLDRWAERLTPLAVLVAEDGGRVVGFASWQSDGYLDHLFTHADRQCRGVATALAERVEAAMRDAGVAVAFADVSVTARPFFERRGYAVVREQSVVVRGVSFMNYRMEKRLRSPDQAKTPE